MGIMDGQGALLPPNSTGEIVIRGPNVTAGYESNPKANAEAFDPAVAEIAHITRHLLDDLVTSAPPKNREVEAAKARERSAGRYANTAA